MTRRRWVWVFHLEVRHGQVEPTVKREDIVAALDEAGNRGASGCDMRVI
jgi:hypothetical protein